MELPDTYFHTGIVVRSMELAIKRFSDVLGIKFTEPLNATIPCVEEAGNAESHSLNVVAAYSRTKPPYYELLEATGEGILSVKNADRILYHGVWESDMAGRIESLKRQDVAVDACFRRSPELTPFAIFTSPSLAGTRIEYVDLVGRPRVEEWVRTGKYPSS